MTGTPRALYDIGIGYSAYRRPDPRLTDALGRASTVVNVGAPRQVAQVFRERGLGFIRTAQQQFPAIPGDPLPSAAVLERLEATHPGFQAWSGNIVP
ncbi:MAG TPA: hypothetical protein VEY93_06345 [Longimicrobium sp.]|nr:hypothetical protein [Longimicrobium sp.]